MRTSPPSIPSSLRGVRALLPHEAFFALLFAGIMASLFAAGVRDRVLFLSFGSVLIVLLLLVVFCQLRPTAPRWRLRLLYYPLVTTPVYALLPRVVSALGIPMKDDALQRIDGFLIGGDLSLRLQPFASPPLTDLLSAAYLFYLLYFGVSQLVYLLDELELAVRFYTGLFTVFALGFAGYVLVPALGPYLAFPDAFTVPLAGGLITRINDEAVRLGTIRTNVFPSLHLAVPAFILAFDYRYKRTRFWVCLVPCLLLFVSTIYLRYHYLVDLLAGVALALVAFALATRWIRPEEPASIVPGSP